MGLYHVPTIRIWYKTLSGPKPPLCFIYTNVSQLPNDIKLFDLSQNSIVLEPYSTRPFPSGFFHLALYLRDFFFHLAMGVRCSPLSFLCLGEPLLLIAEYYSTKWMKCSSFPRFLGGHLACPQFYTITSKAAINIHMQVFWVAISFQLSWVNTEEHDWWIIC